MPWKWTEKARKWQDKKDKKGHARNMKGHVHCRKHTRERNGNKRKWKDRCTLKQKLTGNARNTQAGKRKNMKGNQTEKERKMKRRDSKRNERNYKENENLLEETKMKNERTRKGHEGHERKESTRSVKIKGHATKMKGTWKKKGKEMKEKKGNNEKKGKQKKKQNEMKGSCGLALRKFKKFIDSWNSTCSFRIFLLGGLWVWPACRPNSSHVHVDFLLLPLYEFLCFSKFVSRPLGQEKERK